MLPGGQGLPTGACQSVADYENVLKIGKGTYGTVFKARHRRTQAVVAIKQVQLTGDGREREGMPITALREISVLQRLPTHENIVRLLGVLVGSRPDAVFLAFEYCDNDLGSLIDWMKTPFSQSEVKCLFMQLLDAVAHLHAHHVMHRDLKPSNLLLTTSGTLKLCDFGLARSHGRLDAHGAATWQPAERLTPEVVTLWYRAPEVLLGARQYDSAVDTWALGCVMGELLVHEPLMRGHSEASQLNLMCRLLGAPSARIWPEFPSLPGAQTFHLLDQPYSDLIGRFPADRVPSREGLDLLSGLLTYDPHRRMSAAEARRHRYFAVAPLPKAKELLPTFPSLSEQQERVRGRTAAADAGKAALARAHHR